MIQYNYFKRTLWNCKKEQKLAHRYKEQPLHIIFSTFVIHGSLREKYCIWQWCTKNRTLNIYQAKIYFIILIKFINLSYFTLQTSLTRVWISLVLVIALPSDDSAGVTWYLVRLDKWSLGTYFPGCFVRLNKFPRICVPQEHLSWIT